MATNTMTQYDVPSSVFLSFFNQTAGILDLLSISSWQSLSSIRCILMQEQICVLDKVVSDFNNVIAANAETSILSIENVRNGLKDMPSNGCPILTAAMDRMNESARLSFARLVLQSEYLRDIDKTKDSLTASRTMTRDDILEFCGLFMVSVRLPNVLEHILKGTPIFDNKNVYDTKSTMFPDERLLEIQYMILRAIGYDPEHATNEIKRMISSDTSNVSDFLEDEEVVDAISQMSSKINDLLSRAVIQSTNDTFFPDQNSDGFTRVVSVTYSEKLIDAATGKEIENSSIEPGLSPSVEVMESTDGCDDEKRMEDLRLARDASRLQQEILAELLMMRDEERESKLEDAKIATTMILNQAVALPPGTDRVMFLQSISAHDKRRMMIHKLWNNMLIQHAGKPPTTTYQSNLE